MKRLLAAALALVLLLFGCGKETASISVRSLEGSADFGSFTAIAPEEDGAARALVADALSRYPGGLLGQLGPVEILLVAGLTGEDRFSRDHYAGFTQKSGDGWQIVLDVDAATAGTVHHELAHVLDAILTEAGALTEAEWLALCPSGFAWGDDNWEDYPDFFCDAYAMQNMKEDRARVFEDAMQLGPGVYADSPALWLKLEYFSRALREHFDTGGWPVKTAWEEALE